MSNAQIRALEAQLAEAKRQAAAQAHHTPPDEEVDLLALVRMSRRIPRDKRTIEQLRENGYFELSIID